MNDDHDIFAPIVGMFIAMLIMGGLIVALWIIAIAIEDHMNGLG